VKDFVPNSLLIRDRLTKRRNHRLARLSANSASRSRRRRRPISTTSATFGPALQFLLRELPLEPLHISWKIVIGINWAIYD